MKKENIIIWTAGTLLTGLCVAESIDIMDKNIDHLNEYCPLNKVLGVKHQIDKINDLKHIGFYAYFMPKQTTTETINAKIERTDGKTIYSCPVDYELSETKCTKTKELPDRIEIIFGTPVYPDKLKPGVVFNKEDIEIKNPMLANIIEIPSKSR